MEARDAPLRRLPPVDALAAEVGAPRALAVAAARAVLAERRAELAAGADGEADLGARARAWAAARERPGLRRVLNATGVIVHTNLGRAPLPAAARAAVAAVAEGYSNLEWDAATGARGSRHDHVAGLVRELTGADDAMAVNNCAGATLLAAAALGGDIAVSRGQLVEIGGGFRIPEVIAQAGARLVEVGTTNRTRRSDYERAIAAGAGAILRVHPSNFRQLGFTQEVDIEALCELGVPVIDDVGSGVLADELQVLAEEPSVRRSVAAGAALVCFSGDKLLGGPQAGILAGRSEAVAAARAHPLARALRLDKLGLAALEATLRLYLDPQRALREVPVLAMLTADAGELAARAARLAEAIGDGAEVVESVAKVGGGALPLLELPGPVVAVAGDAEALAARLRAADPPVAARIERDRLLLDPRTLADDEVALVAAAVTAPSRSGPLLRDRAAGDE
ncbi:MAG: L-seryl-tRNA(Ser) seleniumtransferase [Solirubrobacteraceae bacterium]|jgi:L-seryl-tRNA(Ser) seleniumtransferase|nr:L-seryl-tRNA(Ser) seleniumtransferase [Solirubrobacteraceae bacterium]